MKNLRLLFGFMALVALNLTTNPITAQEPGDTTTTAVQDTSDTTNAYTPAVDVDTQTASTTNESMDHDMDHDTDDYGKYGLVGLLGLLGLLGLRRNDNREHHDNANDHRNDHKNDHKTEGRGSSRTNSKQQGHS